MTPFQEAALRERLKIQQGKLQSTIKRTAKGEVTSGALPKLRAMQIEETIATVKRYMEANRANTKGN